MSTFDTSALVPVYARRHPRRAEAVQAFEQADEVVVHPCVLAEFSGVMRRLAKDEGHDGNAVARRAVQELLAQPRVVVRSDVDHDQAVAKYLGDHALSFTDAVIVCAQDAVAFDEGIWRARAAHVGGPA